MLKNTNTKARGFTLVELLIVIVVIAILAAISVVAYNGITNRGKTSSGAAAAGQLAKKIEAYNTVHGNYPSYCQLATGTLVPTGTATANTAGLAGCVAGGAVVEKEAKLDDPTKMMLVGSAAGGTYSSALSSNNAIVGVFLCSGGANVYYWNFQATTQAISSPVKAGAGC